MPSRVTEAGETHALGEALKAARVWAGKSHAVVAREVGISQPALWNYEHGLRDPPFTTAVRIAQSIGADLVALAVLAQEGALAHQD